MSRPFVSFAIVAWLLASSIPILAPAGSEGAAAPAPAYGDESYGRFEWLNPYPTGNDLNGVAWNPDGSLALIVGDSGTLVQYDGIKFTTMYTNTSLTFTDVAWYPTGDYALITASGGKLLKYRNGELSDIPTGTTVDLLSIDINPNTGLAAICGDEKTLLEYDGNDITTISSGGRLTLTSVAWDPTGSYALAIGHDSVTTFPGVVLRYWPENRTLRTIFSNQNTELIGLSFSPNDEVALVSGIYYGTSPDEAHAMFWNGTGFTTVVLPTEFVYRTGGTDWAPDGAKAYFINAYELWELSPEGEELGTYELYEVKTMDWRPDGSSALLVGFQGRIFDFDGFSTTQLNREHESGGMVTLNAVAWSPDGKLAVAVGQSAVIFTYDGTRVVDTQTFIRIKVRNMFPALNGVAWHPDGTYALIVGESGTIVKYFPDGTVDTNIQSGTVQNLRAVAWAPNGSYAVIVGDSGTLRRFNGVLSTPVPSATEYTLRGVAFRPNDSMAFIVGGDVRSVQGPTGQVQTSWQVLLQYNGRIVTTSRVTQQGPVFNSVSFSPAVIAADGGNLILIEDYGPFKHYNLSVANNLLGVAWLGDRRDALFVGQGGAAALFNESRRDLRALPSGTVQPVTAVAMRPQGDYALCVGWNGMMLRYFPNAPPAAVTLNKPANVTDNALELSWSQNLDKDFRRYEVFQWVGQVESQAKAISNTTDPARTRLLVSGLTRLTTYTFKVRVWDNAGLWADSNRVSATTLLGNIAPVAVTLRSPSSITSSSMTLKWSQNGDGDFARYELHKSTTKNFAPSSATLLASFDSPDATECSATSLSPSTNYYFKVRTYDTGGLYNDSNQVNATTEAINYPPAAVVLGQPTEISDTSMKLTWSKNEDSDFASYGLYKANQSGFNLSSESLFQTITVQSTTSFTVEGLTNNTTYFFRLRVVDTAGLHNDSNEVTATTTPPNAPPAAVTLEPPTGVGETTVSLRWSQSTDRDFQHYEVHGSTQQGFDITSATAFTTLVEKTQTEYTVAGLLPDTAYYFKVRVQDNTNLFADSNEVSALTEPNRPPAAVSLYWPVAVTPTSMELEWSVSDAADFARYELHKSQIEGFTPDHTTLHDQIGIKDSLRYNVTGLAPNTTYYFKVQVYDTGGLFNDSNEVNDTTLGPELPPVAPVLADPEVMTEATVFLQWTQNRDADFAAYLVHRSTTKGFTPNSLTEAKRIADQRTTSFNVTGLKPNTLYYFKIEVRDQAGLSNLSNEVSGRTLAANVAPIANAGGDRTVTVLAAVQFQGAGIDPDGFIVRFEWDFQDDGTWETNSSDGNATFTYEAVGVFVARLRITDDRGASAQDIANITVEPAVPPNEPPLNLDAGEDTFAYIEEQVFFSVNATDPDGYIVDYQWDFLGDGLFEYSSQDGATASYIYDDAGNYTAVLRVIDNSGGMATATRKVEVVRLNFAPEAKIDSPRENQKFLIDDLVTFSGTSSYDPDGDSMTYLWENPRASKRLGSSVIVRLTLEKGNYTIRLTVSDGELQGIATVNISVIDRPNVRPTVKIEAPSNNAIVKGTITLSGSAKDDQKVTAVEYRIDPTGKWQKATGTRYWSVELDTRPLAAGPHTIYARSFDGTDYSDEAFLRITVDNPVPQEPEAKAFIPGYGFGALALAAAVALWVGLRRRS